MYLVRPSCRLWVDVRGSGFPVLCLHGHPGSSNSLSMFADPLSQRFRTIAPDLRGYGRSRAAKDFPMHAHLDDLEAILDELQVEQCLVLGWSLGGILAMELVLRQPERVRGLILIATAAKPRSSHPPVTWQDLLYTGIASLINRVYPAWQWNINTFGKRSLYRYLLQQHNTSAYTYLAQEGMGAYLNTSGAARRALATALRAGYNRLEQVAQIRIPCLMLAGSEDRHITPKSSHETATRLPQCSWQCYPNTAHLFPGIPSE
ncbi:MAG: alpha/beta hydrolase, partial [Coleofasciculaceae cyanobacterium SM2_3_26]|nr:alpha/beta hydrolase [Coleofasciculaceae cyanobacterium SM2_3_26]